MSRARDFSKGIFKPGTTSDRPNPPSEGETRFNTTLNRHETYINGFWIPISSEDIIIGKTSQRFSFSASDQSWTVPSGVTRILAKCWGSGGGGGHYGGWSFGSWGGGGGFTRGIIPVTPGEVLILRVPRGGYAFPGSTNAPFGGGSSTGGGDNQYAGGGGGYCGIFRSTTPLLIAGAGGGGGSISGYHGMCNGGAGGGLIGRRGEAGRNYVDAAGKGGTQSAGGAASSGSNQSGGAGSYLQGGSAQGSVYGGGGGGGYYGGSAGSYTQGNTMAGGGGGSSYIDSTVVLGYTEPGEGRHPGGISDIDYPSYTFSTYSDVGYGGVQANHGGDGHIIIYY